MFEQGKSDRARPTDQRAARDVGAGATGADEGVASGRADDRCRPGSRHGSVPLVASWPRLCHDLRTPLNAILGNAELLLDGSAGPLSCEARACLGDIQAAGLRMTRQVQLLLELCRARSQPALAVETEVDLLALLAAAVLLAESSSPLRIAPAGARLVLRGDASWLQLLASALAELRVGDSLGRGALQVAVAHDAQRRCGLLRLWWVDFRPDQVPALPLALTDAILDLHNGELVLTPGGVLLCWPAGRMVLLGTPAGGPAGDWNSV